VQFTGRILSLRQANSILGAQSGGEYVAAVAENTGVTIDDFYPVAAAALGLLLAFVVLGYIMGLFKDDTPELLEKTKRLSREVDEHIEKTTESYKAWNRRLPDLFR
jgi:divalent metal cation (Fe/Co/Zn/Cd) transporter